MRKLIVITLIALIPTSSCYANLSLASNEAPQTLVEQPKPQTTPVRPASYGHQENLKTRASAPAGTKPSHPMVVEPSHKCCF